VTIFERTFHLPASLTTLPFAVGDVVSIHVEPEVRAWGYNPCPDGTLARVLGYDGALMESSGPVVDAKGETWSGPWVIGSAVSLLTAAGVKLIESSTRLRLVEASHIHQPARAGEEYAALAGKGA
jgi:hypothetical protein